MELLHTEDVDTFFDAILALENREECYKFFEDALTVREILDIAQRLKAAQMLSSGKSYNDVCTVTGMSTATISRVSKALDRGPGGYKLVLERIAGGEKDD